MYNVHVRTYMYMYSCLSIHMYMYMYIHVLYILDMYCMNSHTHTHTHTCIWYMYIVRKHIWSSRVSGGSREACETTTTIILTHHVKHRLHVQLVPSLLYQLQSLVGSGHSIHVDTVQRDDSIPDLKNAGSGSGVCVGRGWRGRCGVWEMCGAQCEVWRG